MKIFLLGLPGSGKTTLARSLAESLKTPFIDLDADIEQAAGMSIQKIFHAHNEDHFRQLEAHQLKHWCLSEDDFVMATGGGTPCFHDNISLINQSGTSIFLDVPARIIVQRILKTDLTARPLFADTPPDNLKDKIEFMRAQRIPFYRQAHRTIGVEANIPELLDSLRTGTLR